MGEYMTKSNDKPANPLARILSLLRTGPQSLVLRFKDQFRRRSQGFPVWELSEVSPHVYLGGQHTEKGWQAMQDFGITAVINMRETYHDDVARGIGGERHLHLATRDNTPPTIADLTSGARFIAEEVERGGKVYVHCGVGVGRAPSAVAAYLIAEEGLTAAEALRRIREVRPFVHLTSKQFRQLQKFEELTHANGNRDESAT